MGLEGAGEHEGVLSGVETVDSAATRNIRFTGSCLSTYNVHVAW